MRKAALIAILGAVLAGLKKFEEAETYLRKAIGLKLLQFTPDHWEVALSQNSLGACLLGWRKYREAEPWLVNSYRTIIKQFGISHSHTQRAGSRLIALYEGLGQKTKAEAIKTELEMTQQK